MTKNIFYLLILVIVLIGCKQKNNKAEPKVLASEISGEQIFVESSCGGCHSIDGSESVGPTLNKIFGKTIILINGDSILADENYIYESIVNPLKDIVYPYPATMSSYKEELSEDEINALVKYIKNLNN